MTALLRRVGRASRRSVVPVGLAACALAGPWAVAGIASAAPPLHVASTVTAPVEQWTQTLPDPVALGSPNVATLDGGGPAVIVGDENDAVHNAPGVYAFHLSGGSPVAGWPALPGAPVNSTPSVLGAGSAATVFAATGDAAQVTTGGIFAFNSTGSKRWNTGTAATPSGGIAGVQSSPSIGALEDSSDVVAGDLGQELYELNAATGGVKAGFPWLQADTNLSTAAIADLNASGTNDIIVGGASTYNPVPIDGFQYLNGGHLRILAPTGNAGQANLNGGLVCNYNTTQEVDSSPAVGQFPGPGQVGIVFGTSNYAPYQGNSDQNNLIALNPRCGLLWQHKLDSATTASPALVNALGSGGLQVAEGTQGGVVYLLNGATGATIWSTTIPGSPLIFGGVSSADLYRTGYQDIIVPTVNGVYILDGRTGAVLTSFAAGIGVQNTPLVTDDPNGTLGITVAGYNGLNQGVVAHYEVTASNGSLADEAGAWPMFHHDPQLTGNAGTPPPPHCSAPRGGPLGYEMAASDGGVFTFGNLQFCGSTGSVVLNKPVVGMHGTTDGGGYWMVAADGGIFNFGDARFYGSTGGIALNKPIVTMAPTHDGNGYWLAASDGGIFNFGDAGFHGSLGNLALNKPIVGMAPTPDGGGYWLVASDGGIFTFGDARFYGSLGNVTLNKPIVAMAATPDGKGYWLVASDGGVFTFGDATFHGSLGNILLNKPIVATAATPDGGGYWLFASDGGVFTFGDAKFYGSLGSIALNKPVVAATGYGA